MLRVLGKGKTAKAIKALQSILKEEVCLYDEDDFTQKYDKNSNDFTIVSPGIPPNNFMVKASKNIISDCDYFCKNAPLNIWVSGTNGKTTTVQMCEKLFLSRGVEVGGNIGTPLASMDKNAKFWVLELSSFTLHYTKTASPSIYILLPISEDHISWHGSFEAYEKAKLSPLDKMKQGDTVILPSKYLSYPTSALKIPYENSDSLCEYFKIDKKKVHFPEPFLLDALLVLSLEKILFNTLFYDKINAFKLAPHRMEKLKDKLGRTWINDSKATNVCATIEALKPLKNENIYLILGGDDKGADLNPLFELLKNYKVEIFSIGTNTKKLFNMAKDFKIKCEECFLLKNALEKINQKHNTSSLAILSPAASSLDQFSSFGKRGDDFKEFVGALK